MKEDCYIAGTPLPVGLVIWYGDRSLDKTRPIVSLVRNNGGVDYLAMMAVQLGQNHYASRDTSVDLSKVRYDTNFLRLVFAGAEEKLLAFAAQIRIELEGQPPAK